MMIEVCGNCKYNQRTYDGHCNAEFCCGNENSENYSVPTLYDDTCDEWVLKQLPSAQPEPIWGLPVSADRPLADREIIPRLRSIQMQVGGSYAIDRAIEIIEAVAGKESRWIK